MYCILYTICYIVEVLVLSVHATSVLGPARAKQGPILFWWVPYFIDSILSPQTLIYLL